MCFRLLAAGKVSGRVLLHSWRPAGKSEECLLITSDSPQLVLFISVAGT